MRDLSQSLFTPPALVFLLRLFLPAALTYGLQFVALLRGTFMLRAPLPVTLINSFVPMRRVHRVVRHVESARACHLFSDGRHSLRPHVLVRVIVGLELRQLKLRQERQQAAVVCNAEVRHVAGKAFGLLQ